MVKRVVGMYFSPTGTTEKIVQELVEILAIKFGCEKAYVDFTLPGIRETAQSFGKEDLCLLYTSKQGLQTVKAFYSCILRWRIQAV